MSNVRDSDLRSGPDRYITQCGVAKRLPEYMQDYRHPVIVTGIQSAHAFMKHCAIRELPAPALRYDGTATIRNARELAGQIVDADVIVGIGGGKLSDTVKNVAEILHCRFIMVPTLAATCAAYSALSVNYDDSHRYVSASLHERNSDLLLVDPELIATAPIKYIVGGIGDTLAKWYESVPVFERSVSLTAFDGLAQRSAALIRDILLEESMAAINALRRGDVDEHVHRVVDTIIGLGGTVGGFGGVRARASGAHAMHDALTMLPQSTQLIHGAKVAYGIIVQLLAEHKSREVSGLVPFYTSIGLPYTFAGMGLDPAVENFTAVAQFAAGRESAFRLAVPDISVELVVEAMEQAELLNERNAAHGA